MFEPGFLVTKPKIAEIKTAIDSSDLKSLRRLVEKQGLANLITKPLTADNGVRQCGEFEAFTLLHYACAKASSDLDNKAALETVIYLMRKCVDKNVEAIFKKQSVAIKPLDLLLSDDRKYVQDSLNTPPGISGQKSDSGYCRPLLFSAITVMIVSAGVLQFMAQLEASKPFRPRGPG